MPRDYTSHIKQLEEAIRNCKMTLAGIEEANRQDGTDRSGSVASINRDLGSYEKQLADLRKQMAPAPPEAVPEKKEKSPK